MVLVKGKDNGKYLLVEGDNDRLEMPSKVATPLMDVCTAAELLLEEVRQILQLCYAHLRTMNWALLVAIHVQVH